MIWRNTADRRLFAFFWFVVSIASLVITNAKNRTVLKIVPNSYPGTKIQARKEFGDDSLVEFVQVGLHSSS